MSLQNYGLLRGAVIDALPFKKIGDHYNVEVNAAGQLYRIALDVYSELKGAAKSWSDDGTTTWDVDRLVMFYKDEQYTHPFLATLLTAAGGFTTRDKLPAALHLDYLRYKPALFPLAQMKVVPPKDPNGNGADLNDDLDPWIQKAKNNPSAEIFAFGSGWDDSTSTHPDPNPYFNPDPKLGVHDIHMNQGDTGSQKKNNGAGQDGALFIRFAGGAAGSSPDTWVAMFFRFQNQSTSTDANGNPA